MVQRRNATTLPHEARYRHWGHVGINRNQNNNNRSQQHHTQSTTTQPQQPQQPPTQQQRRQPTNNKTNKTYTQTTLSGHRIQPTKSQKRRQRRKKQRAQPQRIHQQQQFARLLRRQTLQQSSIQGKARNDNDEFGDRLTNRKKPSNAERLLFHNISSLPEHANPNHQRNDEDNKNHTFCKEIKDTEADICCFNEHGLNLDKIPAEDQWHERSLYQLPQHKAFFAYNTSDPYDMQEPTQWGGTGIIAMKEIIPRLETSGKDPTNLGRWTWIKLQGRQGHITRIVCAYRPV